MSTILQLSTQQKKIIEENRSKFVVKASAGTGKTTVLVQRYLMHVLERGISPENILCITFTKKAAAEMKKRIIFALIEREAYDAAQVAETGPVQTLHSFCENILRENALYGGYDAEFSILDDADLNTLIQRAITDVLDEIVSDKEERYPSGTKDFLYTLAGEKVYGFVPALEVKISREIRAVLGALRSGVHSREYLEEIYKDSVSCIEFWKKCILENLNLGDTDFQDEVHLEWKLWKKHLKQILNQRGVKIPRWLAAVADEDVERDASDTVILMQITLKVWEKLECLMRKLQKFDFAYIERSAVDLLERDGYVKSRIRQKYRVVMVDESQDLNPVQYKLVQALDPEVEMLVGDPQQSIYKFRNADYKLFHDHALQTHVLPLTNNYRSQEGILRYVDDFFYAHWRERYQNFVDSSSVAVTEDDPFVTADSEEQSVYRGIEYWMDYHLDTNDVASRVERLIKEDGWNYRDIAILCRRISTASEISSALTGLNLPNTVVGGSEKFFAKLEIKDVYHALVSLVNPLNDFSMLSLLRGDMVGLQLETIVEIAAEKPIFKHLEKYSAKTMEENEKIAKFLTWFRKIHSNIDRYSAWEALHELYDQSGFLEKLLAAENLQAYANVRKLLTMAALKPECNPLLFSEYIYDIQSLNHREGESPIYDANDNTIKILTIHKSKGLEFPVVILPDVYSKIHRSMPSLYAESDTGLVCTRYEKSASALFRMMHESVQLSSYEEELRVLYVAFTRAKEKLCLLTHLSPSNETVGGIIHRTINPEDGENMGIKVRKK